MGKRGDMFLSCGSAGDPRSLRDDRGAVVALVAVLVPVFILLTALVVDAGFWYTHKRQLQNRADAAAFAAGVQYGFQWTACAGSNAAAKDLAAQAIERVARQYAGDPIARPSVGYDPTSPAAVNTEIASQSPIPADNKLDVVINSTSYTAGTDYSDGGGTLTSGGPCFDHNPGDTTTPEGGYWVDVKVKERDHKTLFGAFGLDLFQNTARARIWIGRAVADNRFIPLAVPETEILQAQLRYYSYCGNTATELARFDLVQLDSSYQTDPNGATYWGPSATPSGRTLQVPPASSCSDDYIPIAAEVRVAGRPSSVVDIDTPTCAALQPQRFADCFTRVSTIRGWKNTPAAQPPSNQAWIKELSVVGFDPNLVGSPTCAPDGLFARDSGSASCTFRVDLNVDFQNISSGTRLNGCSGSCKDNYTVEVRPAGGGWTALTAPDSVDGTWSQTLTSSTAGRSELEVRWSWTDTNPSHSAPGGGSCKNGNNNPCQASGGAYNLGSVFLANDSNAGSVDLVRTAGVGQTPGSRLGSPISSTEAGVTSNPLTIYPTVGLRSSLRDGQKRVLRVGDPQSNQSVDCEPSGGQGHEFAMFYLGCNPFYGPNSFTQGTWWNTTTKECPPQNVIFNQPNSETAFWQCVPAAPGFSSSVLADGIAARTGNCTDVRLGQANNLNSCNSVACVVPNDYVGWRNGTSAYGNGYANKRLVKLFIVPYGAFKGVNANDGLPLSRFAAFYVTGWGGQGSNRDPCTTDPDGPQGTNPDGSLYGTAQADDAVPAGAIAGYFVDFVKPGGGAPVTLKCEIGSATECRAVLVR